MRLAFDISSTNIGVCVMSEDKKYVWVNSYKINYDENDLLGLGFQIDAMITNLNKNVEWNVIPEDNYLGLEVSNFKNAKLTQRFSLIAGMIIAFCYFIIGFEVKIFNSNEWQRLIGCNTTDTRDVRKQKSKEFYYQKTNKWNDNDDETDAFCIAYHLDMLNTTHQTHINAQNKAKQERMNKSTIAKLNKQIITRQEKLLKLKPSQIKMKAKLENEINEIKARISATKN